MSSKVIILTTSLLLLIAFSALFVLEAKNHDPDYQKNWSVVYFDNPRDESLDFTVENHEGKVANYDYKIFSGDKRIAEGRIEIEPGKKQDIAANLTNVSGKITISVMGGGAEYKIYKDL